MASIEGNGGHLPDSSGEGSANPSVNGVVKGTPDKIVINLDSSQQSDSSVNGFSGPPDKSVRFYEGGGQGGEDYSVI